METTKIFESGNSQAVRLPKAYRFDSKEVEILRRGEDVILRPIKPNLVKALKSLPTLPEDCFADGRLPQGELESRDWDDL